MTDATLFLLTGLPGAGKTVRARELLDGSNAVYLTPDEWIVALDVSLVDYAFRFKLQDRLLVLAGELLRAGVSVVIEFGSWSREEREEIRRVGEEAGARTELHFVDAPLDELVRRVRSRGGPEAEELVTLLVETSGNYVRPTPDEGAAFDRYVGPED